MQKLSVLNLVFKLVMITVQLNSYTTEFTVVVCRFKSISVI